MALARRQHGVVSTRRLLDAGVGPHAIEARTAGGWLRRLHRGVYAVGALESDLTDRQLTGRRARLVARFAVALHAPP